jgi:hypothetical protein
MCLSYYPVVKNKVIEIQIMFLIHLVVKLIVHTQSLRYWSRSTIAFCELVMNVES